MSYQAYLDNIQAKTGKSPEDFRALAQSAGLLHEGTKATQITDWLKADFGLGTGHARAIWGVFVANGWVEPKKTAIKKR